MDPMSRKLFQNSEARSRLAKMGGIMASSPDLAGTVARFQVGGDVAAPRRATYMGTPFDVFPDGRIVQSTTGAELANTPENMDLRAALLSQLGGIEPPPTPAEAIGLDPGAPAFGSAMPNPELFPSLDMPVDVDLEARGTQGRVGRPLFTPRTPESIRSEAESAAAAGLSDVAAELLAEADALEAEQASAPGMDQGTPLEFDDIGELLPPPTQEPPVEDPTPLPGGGEETPSPPPGGTGDQDPLAEAGAQIEQDLRTFFGIEQPSREAGTRRERVNQELELIREVFGDRTRDQARDRAMHLAMIGLAIAAGQSPNALANIAQGALAGTQAMARAQQAQQEREDEMRMMAYRTVLSEDERAQNLTDQMGLARFRASLGGEGSRFGTITHPVNQWFTTRNQLDQQARDPSSDLWAQLREMPEAERSAYLDREAFDRVISGFGAMTPEVGDLRAALESGQLGRSFASAQGQGGVPGQIPVVTSREEYDNLPSGAEFIQNGQRRRKP